MSARRHLRIAVLAALCSAAVSSAVLAQPSADEAYETPAFKTCLAAKRSTVDIIKCQVAEAGRQASLLQDAYTQRLARLSAPARPALVADEAAWAAAADAKCAPERARRGLWGSVAAQGCRIDILIQRSLALQGPG